MQTLEERLNRIKDRESLEERMQGAYITLTKKVTYAELAYNLQSMINCELVSQKYHCHADFSLVYMPLLEMKNIIAETKNEELINLFNKASKNIYRKRDCWIYKEVDETSKDDRSNR